jgi:UDP:flavonoid glycosyltransferase YjiC (YdhE family)
VRVLFTCRPLAGHFQPLVPLARALVATGHDVAFATGDPALARGFEAFAAGPGPEFRERWRHRIPPREVLATDEGRRWFFVEIFAKLELPPRAADLRRILARWRPDMLVHDLAELAGPLVASEAGLPYATAGYGVLPPKPVIESALAAPLGALYLDPYPPSLQRGWVDEFAAVQRVRSVVAARAPLPRDGSVYVTLGTIWNRPETFTAILPALTAEAQRMVVTTGADLDLGPQPAHVRVERFVPQDEILPHVDAVVCHGGSGTVLGALAHGRPLLVLPQGADQFDNADGVVAAGAGLRDAGLRALLEDPRYARAAVRIADEIAAMPPVEEGVSALVRAASR